ncbi:hypothetical protein OUZ56_031627 [Daphnia magna]|uniref:Uncharacterized protein n=1 Tax=Daphnia magna TaxID=35525 RepID=A0ABQ9ZUU9_9CRUS|nr:hypothetical protein OUZ56_031627 [Daphnia magna]
MENGNVLSLSKVQRTGTQPYATFSSSKTSDRMLACSPIINKGKSLTYRNLVGDIQCRSVMSMNAFVEAESIILQNDEIVITTSTK